MNALVADASSRIEGLGNPPLMGHLIAEHDVCAPLLFQWEIGNVLHVKRRTQYGDRATRIAIVEQLLATTRLEPQIASRAAIGTMAEEQGLTFYDAAYLVLAQEENAELLTEDEKLSKAAARVLGRSRVLDLAALARRADQPA